MGLFMIVSVWVRLSMQEAQWEVAMLGEGATESVMG